MSFFKNKTQSNFPWAIIFVYWTIYAKHGLVEGDCCSGRLLNVQTLLEKEGKKLN